MPRLTRTEYRRAMDWQSPNPQGVADSERAKPRRLEEQAGIDLMKWVALQPWRGRLYHWPNQRPPTPGKGGGFNEQAAMRLGKRLQDQGVRRGPSDYWLFYPLHGCPGAVMELKRDGATRSALDAEQREFLLDREADGWAVACCRGWIEASEFFRDYVAGVWAADSGEWWR